MASDLLHTWIVISNPLISYVDIIFNLVICTSTPDLFYKNTKTQLGDQTRGHEDTTIYEALVYERLRGIH